MFMISFDRSATLRLREVDPRTEVCPWGASFYKESRIDPNTDTNETDLG